MCKGSGPVWTCYLTCAPVAEWQVQGSARTSPRRVTGNLGLAILSYSDFAAGRGEDAEISCGATRTRSATTDGSLCTPKTAAR
jgi:hypothetical protein